MKIVWPWERKKVEKELGSIEQMLASAFKPVPARPAFVNDLRKRLVGSKNPLARVSLSTLELLLLIGGAIVGVFALLFTIVRAIIGVFGRLRPGAGKLGQPRPPREKKPKVTTEPKKRAA
ncbi:MAG TPA: hypothetical protein VI703_05355 [Anaerolineales bacterium]|jgi:hypothetical protein|nr:hypothetical protein [Anaerolineales bacterium]